MFDRVVAGWAEETRPLCERALLLPRIQNLTRGPCHEASRGWARASA